MFERTLQLSKAGKHTKFSEYCSAVKNFQGPKCQIFITIDGAESYLDYMLNKDKDRIYHVLTEGESAGIFIEDKLFYKARNGHKKAITRSFYDIKSAILYLASFKFISKKKLLDFSEDNAKRYYAIARGKQWGIVCSNSLFEDLTMYNKKFLAKSFKELNHAKKYLANYIVNHEDEFPEIQQYAAKYFSEKIYISNYRLVRYSVKNLLKCTFQKALHFKKIVQTLK